MVVTVDEVKTHLRIQQDEEDGYIDGLIAQAQAAAEDFCRVQFSDPAPEPVRLAVLLMVSHYYENRDNPDKQVYVTMRIAFENLLYPYRDPDQGSLYRRSQGRGHCGTDRGYRGDADLRRSSEAHRCH